MKYSEIFYTLQGEGKWVGTPSVFFRTSYCNLRCGWCDTPFTSWHPENKDITAAEAFQAITEYSTHHVVITGGEPFIQGEELTALCTLLAAHGHHITIETNATVFVPVQAHLISMIQSSQIRRHCMTNAGQNGTREPGSNESPCASSSPNMSARSNL